VALVREAALRVIDDVMSHDDGEKRDVISEKASRSVGHTGGVPLEVGVQHMTAAITSALASRRITPDMLRFYEHFRGRG